MLHRVLEVRTAVAVSGDAVSHDEREAVGLHGRAYQLGGVWRTAKYPIRRATTEVAVVAATHAPSASAQAFVAP